jgi:hypothetical protein
MNGKSLVELKKAFWEWRKTRAHVKEAAPAVLMMRAREAAVVHGVGAVCRATGVDRRRLAGVSWGASDRSRQARRTPAFSRVEIVAPAASVRPFAEVETGTGLKVRFFGQTPEALGLLSSLFGAGVGR